MTDAELIARLRDAPADGLGTENLCLAAADRIEALIEERSSLLAGHRALNIGGARLQDRAETAEAKLAQAVEALEYISGNGNAAGRNPQLMADKARATLAEIKGESHE